MWVSLLLTLREGLEAALIVGIVFGYLRKTNQMQHARSAVGGVFAAVVASAALATGIVFIGAELEGRAEQIFEGVTMLLAVIVLTWMIFWMQSQSRTMKTSLEGDVQKVVESGAVWGLFALTFLSVFREGVETALFIGAAAFQTSAIETIIGSVIGLSLATILGYMVYASTAKLNLRVFFNVTSFLLLIFAAGLFMHSVHEFQEVGLLPTVIEQLWNTSFLISEESLVGQFLRTLVGYTSAPSLVELIAYISYWIITLLGVRWWANYLARKNITAIV